MECGALKVPRTQWEGLSRPARSPITVVQVRSDEGATAQGSGWSATAPTKRLTATSAPCAHKKAADLSRLATENIGDFNEWAQFRFSHKIAKAWRAVFVASRAGADREPWRAVFVASRGDGGHFFIKKLELSPQCDCTDIFFFLYARTYVIICAILFLRVVH